MENLNRLFLQNLAFGIDIHPIEGQALDYAECLALPRFRIALTQDLENHGSIEDRLIHQFRRQGIPHHLDFRFLGEENPS